jgi:2'-5' RNA ligase
MSAFVLLELLDPGVNAFLNEIWIGLHQFSSRRLAHITIRGPYTGAVPTTVIEEYSNLLKYDGITIGGVGYFPNANEQVVFLRVSSPNLRQAWWKPDYPIEKYGFAPHISLYRGHDGDLAQKFYEFMCNENVHMVCSEHRLVVNKVNQGDFFRYDPAQTQKYENLIDLGYVQRGFADRFSQFLRGSDTEG